MIEKAKRYHCGACGANEYALYAQEDNTIDLFVECLQCGSISMITYTLPKIDICWYKNSEGIIHTD
jgi:uncharacterized Zn finger protein